MVEKEYEIVRVFVGEFVTGIVAPTLSRAPANVGAYRTGKFTRTVPAEPCEIHYRIISGGSAHQPRIGLV